MRLPLSWLNDYVKVDDIDPRELAEKLTRAGLQVESVESVGGSDLSDLIVVAEVLECEAHPNSDHLHVCKVTDGKEEFQVVCGAPNMRKGIKTAFAKVGAPIPGFLDKNGKPEKIKKGRLRGVDSFGMCCSEKELCIGEGSSGIIEYPAETPNGALVRDVAKLDAPETVFDVEVTWNRPDALSVLGLAREFGAILGRPVNPPPADFEECGVDVGDEVKVVVENPAKCLRYTARVVTDMTPDAPSPDWMAKRLELCGVRSLGLAVDVTNYVMLELGAPLHAFDHTRLKDRTIIVRDARAGERMKTLDGVDRELDPSILVICDAEKPGAVAGVMGGENSGIAPGTRTIMLESALFDPAAVKDSSSRLGLSSESSYRYIRGVDKAVADFASRRAAHLLQKYGAAKIAKGFVDVDNREKPGPKAVEGAAAGTDYSCNATVSLDFGRARKLIGIDISDARMVELLKSIGLAPAGEGDGTVDFAVPSWRWDISMEADLVEEIARLHGLDNIPDAMPSAPSVSRLSDEPFRARCRARELCLALGFSEAMHYSFLSARELDDFDSRDEVRARRLAIPDPVSADFGVMRDSLLPQMYMSLGRNSSHEESAMLFEIGRTFRAESAGGGAAKPVEGETICLGIVGPAGREALRRRAAVTEEEAVLWMKGAVCELVAKLHAGRVEFAPARHPAFAAALEIRLNGRAVGVLGAVSAKLRHPFRLTTQMSLCEMELAPLLKRTGATGRVSSVPQFPAVRRDIAITVGDGVTHEDIVGTIRRNGGRELTKVELFDIFKTSRAYSLEFRSNEKTLTDDEVGKAFRRVVDALKAMANVEVREN